MTRMEARLKDHEELDEWMREREETNRSLALSVALMTGRKVSVSKIAHLRRGARAYCPPADAKAIEKVLKLKHGQLFVREVIGGSEAVRRTA